MAINTSSIWGKLSPILGGVVGVGALLSGLFFGGSKSTNSNTVSAPLVTTDTAATTADSTATPTPLTPQIVGFGNKENQGGALLSVFGENVFVYPNKGMKFYSLVQGLDAYTYGAFDLGYGELAISALSIGSRVISEFPDIMYEIQYGKAADTAFSIVLQAQSTTSLSVPLTYNSAKTSRAGHAVSKLSVEIDFPNGLWDSNIFFPAVKEAFTVNFTIEYKKQTDVSWSSTSLSVSDLQVNAFRVYHEWAVASEGTYDVRITKTTGDSSSFPFGVYTDGRSDATWSSVGAWGAPGNPFNTIKDAKGNPVYISRIAFKAKETAETQNLDGDLNCLVTRKLRHWNGTTFDAPAGTSNPSDIALEILTGQANPDPVNDSDVDLASFLDFYNWCSTNSLTYRRAVDQGVSAKALLDEVCAAGRACCQNINGKWTIIIDRPQSTPVQHFTQRSIIKDSFTCQANLGITPHVIAAKFLNPDLQWQEDLAEVYDTGYDSTNATERQELQLPGVTSFAQAHKAARYFLASTRLQFWTYIFSTPVKHLKCRIGDRILVTHQGPFAGLGQARISALVTDGSGNITGLTLDAPQDMLGGSSYGLILLPDGLTEMHLSLVTVAGTFRTFSLSTPISAGAPLLPAVGCEVSYGIWGSETKDCLITDIIPAEDFSAQIKCVDYNDAVYAADTDPIPAYVSKLSIQSSPIVTLETPVVVAVESGTSALIPSGSRLPASSILITVRSMAAPAIDFEYQYRLTGSSRWSASQTVPATSTQIRITGVDDGTAYDVQIRARAGNNIGAWNTDISSLVVVGKTEPPPDVPLTLHRVAYTNVIAWYYDSAHGVTVPLDFAGYEVRMAWGSSANWEQAIVLSPMHLSTQYDLGGLAKGLKTIMVKAVDMSGNYQAGPAASINLDFGDVLTDNIVHNVPVDLSSLAVTNGAMSGGALKANDDGALWWGDDLSAEWFPDPQNSDWWDTAYLSMTVEWQYLPPTTEPKPFRLLEQLTLSGQYKIEYRIYGQAPWFPDPLNADWWDGNLSDPWWDDSDPQYVPLPDGGLQGEWITFYFRLTFFAGSTQGILSALAHVIDVPDIIEYINDFLVDNTAGKRVTLSNTYRSIENVNLTLQKNGSYPSAASAQRLDKSVSGPLIQVLDTSNSGTTGIVDVIIKGY